MTEHTVYVPRHLQKLGNALEPVRDLLKEGLFKMPPQPRRVGHSLYPSLRMITLRVSLVSGDTLYSRLMACGA